MNFPQFIYKTVAYWRCTRSRWGSDIQQNIWLSQSWKSEECANTLSEDDTEILTVFDVFQSHSLPALHKRVIWSLNVMMMLVGSLVRSVRSVLCPLINWWRGGLHHQDCYHDGKCIWINVQGGRCATADEILQFTKLLLLNELKCDWLSISHLLTCNYFAALMLTSVISDMNLIHALA